MSAEPVSSNTTSWLPSAVRFPHAVPKLAPVKSNGAEFSSTAFVAVPQGSRAVGTLFQVASAVAISPEMSVGPLSRVSAMGN